MGIAHIRASFNNTIVTLTDKEGNTISWASTGKVAFKGSKKSTPFAAQMAAEAAAKEAMAMGLRRVEVWVKGPGVGREAAVRSLQGAGLEISAIKHSSFLELRKRERLQPPSESLCPNRPPRS